MRRHQVSWAVSVISLACARGGEVGAGAPVESMRGQGAPSESQENTPQRGQSVLDGGSLPPARSSDEAAEPIPLGADPAAGSSAAETPDAGSAEGGNSDASTAGLPVGPYSPAFAAVDVPIDTPLRLLFDAPPVLDSDLVVAIRRDRDGAVVDTIAASADVDVLGPETGSSAGRRRYVRRQPIAIQGNELWIAPHQGVLDYGETYSVDLPAPAVSGEVAGQAFAGTLGTWTFQTKLQPPAADSLTVDDDGDADFRTLQGALTHLMARDAAGAAPRVFVRNGAYRELLFLRGVNNLSVIGESREGVVFEYENSEAFNPGTGRSATTEPATPDGGRALFLVEAADLLTLENLTLHNTHRRATGTGDQAEALYFNSDAGRLVVKNATFSSEQDTVQLKGYAWFYRSLVEGNVDFIWGNNRASLFEECEIRTLGDSRRSSASGGYVVQARTVAAQDRGFVFLNSVFTSAAGPGGTPVASGGAADTYFARSGGSASYFDNVTVIGCRLGDHLAPGGWAQAGVNGQPAPNPAQAGAASGWREFGSLDLNGTPLDLSRRAAAARVLAATETADFASRERVFAGFGIGGWQPEP